MMSARAATTTVPLKGDLVRTNARRLHRELRAVGRRRDGKTVVLDFSGAGRIDSSGIAVISVLAKQLARSGRTLELTKLSTQQEAALALLPKAQAGTPSEPTEPAPGTIERLGGAVIEAGEATRSLFGLIAEIGRQTFAVILRRKRLPAGALAHQISIQGVDAIFIVGLLSFLLGMTMAFQGSIQLQRFGAGPFVADMIGLTMVREIGPLMTAVILTGRTGAAIAAELGTMQVRSEIDALSTMGIEPVRFLILPRLISITLVGPALALLGMFIGMAGGMLVATLTLDLPPAMFWARMVERLELADFMHGLGKSLVFAWIIGLAGSHLGLRAGGDASSVGNATTRTVVVGIFYIIVVDAIFATVTLFMRHG
ncbi:MAG: ABC transporter permease [Myxococcales bacterium]|nr:ABC transporter permease [Myxococcales bacterium]